MKAEDAKLGYELVGLIEIQKEVIQNLGETLNYIKNNNEDKESLLDDKCFHLNISEYADGSGWYLNLNRYYGNLALLEAIMAQMKKELEQLEDKLVKL